MKRSTASGRKTEIRGKRAERAVPGVPPMNDAEPVPNEAQPADPMRPPMREKAPRPSDTETD